MVATSEIFDLLLAMLFLLLLLGEEELGALHPVDMHKFIARLGHWKLVSFPLLEPAVEICQLLVLVEHVLHVADLDGGRLRDLLLQIVIKMGVRVALLLIIHR